MRVCIAKLPQQVLRKFGFNHMPWTKSRKEELLDTQRIVLELKAERNRLDRAIAALDETTATPTRATIEPSRKGAQAPRKRHHLTAAGRKRLSVLMKKRWAEKRKKISGRK
jgi:hypothetical protein